MVKQSDMRKEYTDTLISDFTDPLFQRAFQQYFGELGITVKDWDGLFREMNEGNEGKYNRAFVRTGPEGSVLGFIQFIPIRFASWFFEETCGFIREFWVSDGFRNKGHGSGLIALTERYFLEQGITISILTTDTAGRFYEQHGYVREHGCKAKNQDEVFVKRLG